MDGPGVLGTPGFAHYNLSWSPFHNSRLAVASAANYGLVGNGRLHLTAVALTPGGMPTIALQKFYETQDGVYDVAWSEIHENQLVSSSGDGSIKLWDATLNDRPIQAWQEHTREVFCVDWSNINKQQFVSSSWDGLVKLWTPDLQRSMTTLHAHQACVYQALFSPHQPDVIATCSTDGTVRVFDLRSPAYASTGSSFTVPLTAAALTVPASGGEVLAIDWNKYRPFVLASAGVDKVIRVWDCRMVRIGPPPDPNARTQPQVGGQCEAQMLGHEYAIRKVQWSPHRPDVLASASYDMTCRIWSTNPPDGRNLMRIHDAHTEFVVGCAWSLFDEGVLATASWDLNPEDILSTSLETLYDYAPITHSSPGAEFVYKSPYADAAVVTLTTPDAAVKNWALHASSIWVASIFIADHIHELGIPANPDAPELNVLELGAGAGLPGILLAKTHSFVRVVVSDYPDTAIVHALEENAARNDAEARCSVVAYAWGTDPAPLLAHASGGFDCVLAADTLWNPDLHEVLIDTIKSVLARRSTACAHLVAGLHTGRYTIEAFCKLVCVGGLRILGAMEWEVGGDGQRPWDVTRAEGEDERERRRWVVWIRIAWPE
ncbi:WD40-repeat-containing domain protein [Vararia minispora EC-137]|uniref:WD40-repeat-containing domain protein n=1 Tax=Vararia minispora EC-137 TaxID=1314806 RepID=A0ACB8QPW7_9AGAM|nr:WD40-repeat-containing domain protein [Vararia minispora EC-137]